MPRSQDAHPPPCLPPDSFSAGDRSVTLLPRRAGGRHAGGPLTNMFKDRAVQVWAASMFN
eukprot:5377529-Alexandrium_andersonii.AAC.1